MKTSSTARTTNRGTLIGMVGVGILLAAVLIGGLLIALRSPAPVALPASAPAAQVAAPAAPAGLAAPASIPGLGNRSFADEIAAGAGLADWSAPQAPVVLPQHGPR